MDAESPLPLIDGRYRLLRLLAVGGMGEVYLAAAKDDEIEGLEQLVVIKRILPEFASDPNVVTMFLIEARIAARLDHPNVVRVYDMGKADGAIYFTMEYLHGADLGQLIEKARRSRERFPLGHALTITLSICAGLHFAHEMRRVDGRPMAIVHRDVSPSNVFITFHGEIKLVDFGIATVASSTKQTQDGITKGKCAYMSPEQVKNAPLDRRSDIFGIGILLFEMVTLTHLFDGENEYAIMEQIARGEIATPSSRRPGILPALERIMIKALAYKPEDRYQSALELGLDLERFAQAHNVPLSHVSLRQFLARTIGEVPFPWYTDEQGPEEAQAIQHWFRGAQPDDANLEFEDVDVNLSDMFELELEEVFEPDEPTPPPARLPAPIAPPPPRRAPPTPLLIGGGVALAGILLALIVRSCGQSPPPPEEPAPVAIVPTPPPPVQPPTPPPPVTPPPPADDATIILPEEPAPQPAVTTKKAKKKPKKKSAKKTTTKKK